MDKYLPWLKIILVVAVAFFVIKFVTNWVASKWPNKATQTAAAITASI